MISMEMAKPTFWKISITTGRIQRAFMLFVLIYIRIPKEIFTLPWGVRYGQEGVGLKEWANSMVR
jgi:hypothetical protein